MSLQPLALRPDFFLRPRRGGVSLWEPTQNPFPSHFLYYPQKFFQLRRADGEGPPDPHPPPTPPPPTTGRGGGPKIKKKLAFDTPVLRQGGEGLTNFF